MAFHGVDDDLALAFLGFLIVGKALAVLVVPGAPACRGELLAAGQLPGVDPVRHTADAGAELVGVVHGDAEGHPVHFLRHGLVRVRQVHVERHDVFPDDVGPAAVFHLAGHDEANAHVGLVVDQPLRQGGMGLGGELGAAVHRMQPHRVERVHEVFLALEPVAVLGAPHPGSEARLQRASLRLQDVVTRQQRHLLQRPHVGEQQSAIFLHRVGGVPDMVLDRAVGRLQRHVEDASLHVVEPAVVAAAQPVPLHPAILQRGAPVAAAEEKESRASLSVQERHQVLAQDADAPGQVGEVRGKAHRLPVPPHQLAAGRAGTHAGKLRIDLGNLEAVGTTHDVPPRLCGHRGIPREYA